MGFKLCLVLGLWSVGLEWAICDMLSAVLCTVYACRLCLNQAEAESEFTVM